MWIVLIHSYIYIYYMLAATYNCKLSVKYVRTFKAVQLLYTSTCIVSLCFHKHWQLIKLISERLMSCEVTQNEDEIHLFEIPYFWHHQGRYLLLLSVKVVRKLRAVQSLYKSTWIESMSATAAAQSILNTNKNILQKQHNNLQLDKLEVSGNYQLSCNK